MATDYIVRDIALADFGRKEIAAKRNQNFPRGFHRGGLSEKARGSFQEICRFGSIEEEDQCEEPSQYQRSDFSTVSLFEIARGHFAFAFRIFREHGCI